MTKRLVKELFHLLDVRASSHREIQDGCLGGILPSGHMELTFGVGRDRVN